MTHKGVKYYRRGPKKKVKVGFYYVEIILALLAKNPEGLTIRQISSRLRIKYTTVRHIVNRLVELNRLRYEPRKIFNGPPVNHYMLTPWRLQ